MVLKRAEDSGTVEKGKERNRGTEEERKADLTRGHHIKGEREAAKPTRAFERARKSPEES